MSRKPKPGDETVTRGVLKTDLSNELATFGAQLRQEMREQIGSFRQEMRGEIRQLLIEFYQGLMKPRFFKLEGEVSGLRTDFEEVHGLRGEFTQFRQETLGRFDDLYKKFEDLKQEYVFTNHQLKGIDFRLERLEQQGRFPRN